MVGNNLTEKGKLTPNLQKLTDIVSEYENTSPTENKMPPSADISTKECNLEISLQLDPEDFAKEGVTFFSE